MASPRPDSVAKTLWSHALPVGNPGNPAHQWGRSKTWRSVEPTHMFECGAWEQRRVHVHIGGRTRIDAEPVGTDHAFALEQGVNLNTLAVVRGRSIQNFLNETPSPVASVTSSAKPSR